MKRMRIMGLGLIAVLAMTALFAASASASAPRFGRCLAKAGGSFKDAACKVGAKAGEEKFEFYPAVTGSSKKGEFKPMTATAREYTSEAIGNTEHKIALLGTGETLGVKTTVECTKQNSDGIISSDNTATAEHIVYTGCESSKVGCSSSGAAAGEIVVKPLNVTLRTEKFGYNTSTKVVEPAKDLAMQEFQPQVGNIFVEFSCATALHVIVESVGVSSFVGVPKDAMDEPSPGGVGRGLLAPAKTNAMVNKATVKFNGTGGGQKPEKIAESINPSTGVVTYSKEVSLIAAFQKPPAPPEFEESGQTQTNNVIDKEKVEVNTVA
jgi:hypothetical protein